MSFTFLAAKRHFIFKAVLELKESIEAKGSVSQKIDNPGNQAHFRSGTVRLPVVNSVFVDPNLPCYVPLEQPHIQPPFADMVA
jgi:hypothetical protein